MATLTITITRADIFLIAEGISVTISQHNGGTPTYEQLWASASEARKLDIYYREAVGDLEQRLMDWAEATHAQFSLTADGDNYTLTLGMSPYWPTRLEGLLKNKVQDFFVHAVTAGWLNDFDGLQVKNDYRAMGATDLTAIVDIIRKREFGFAESERGTNPDEKEDSDHISADSRGEDYNKDRFILPREAGCRRRDDVTKESSDPAERPRLTRPCMDRHVDNAPVVHPKEWTDMSGTGLAYRDEMCHCKPKIGHLDPRGIEVKHCHRPECGGDMCKLDFSKPCRPMAWPDCSGCDRCRPKPAPTLPPPFDKSHPAYPNHPEHPLPPYHANGKGWSDDEYPGVKAEEEFVKNHQCEHHACGHHGIDKLQWDEGTEEPHDESTFMEYE